MLNKLKSIKESPTVDASKSVVKRKVDRTELCYSNRRTHNEENVEQEGVHQSFTNPEDLEPESQFTYFIGWIVNSNGTLNPNLKFPIMTDQRR